ncbi:MAG TPA: deoxyribose-phosphate aldolase [Algoriphagus sp.]|jgi:deoxyribose-phosphate aldolase|uniref:deoxyribose-phosphate aldolase n=1 Tax=unclassified Algoriphagus TaxID=2641541 RepID=UPI000C41F138|nr:MULTISPECIES: deoxyribose-phosphate aldolase [unclassified Algoriphagus]MAL15292.1 deoxyribose-phosphate aldolase [Algoriphagus sp.]QYH40719.1 deoxyribose-phosphate aldolase [Algoriphagus sp. NBT04N3]HAD53015.1 deoxyribose-phosphate aldolase [Algoriphagus sp.]HAH36497.1 deoxyribose-phosphate aldolase [Algoriphagus sp.]HAS57523.1 deoxyribose-phosphate aldolase [Algoriphagus sp.]|tara:strand:+ start:10976 stop:11641 length:666 start_codon:yes stop_codon:yes gene_type:complete
MNKLNRYLESTLLKPTMTGKEVDLLVQDAIEEQFVGVCVPPFWVKKVSRELEKEDIQTVTVIGFPFGFQDTASKVAETKEAIKQGADELDLVWSQTAYHSGMNWPKIEIAQIAKICHEEERILKVIIETAYLNADQIQEACLICQDAGADFVKTSTGYASSGAKVEDIQLMRQTLSSQTGIKASGGIKTLEFAKELIAAGADRIGTSSAKALMDAWKASQS